MQLGGSPLGNGGRLQLEPRAAASFPIRTRGAQDAPDEDARAGCRSPYSKFDVAAMRDSAFLNTMTPEEAEECMGEWIAVVGGGIVAHGRDLERVCEEGRKAAGRLCTCDTFVQGPKRCRGSAAAGSAARSNDRPHTPPTWMRLDRPCVPMPSHGARHCHRLVSIVASTGSRLLFDASTTN